MFLMKISNEDNRLGGDEVNTKKNVLNEASIIKHDYCGVFRRIIALSIDIIVIGMSSCLMIPLMLSDNIFGIYSNLKLDIIVVALFVMVPFYSIFFYMV